MRWPFLLERNHCHEWLKRIAVPFHLKPFAKSDSALPQAVSISCMQVAVIFLIALVARLLVSWEMSATPFFDIYVGDSRNYHEWALRIATGQEEKAVFFQAPLYPYFLGMLYKIFPVDPWTPRVVQGVLAACGCVLLAISAARFFGQKAFWVVGMLAAMYAPGIYYDLLVHKSGVALVLGSLAIFVLTHFLFEKRTAFVAAMVGSAFSLAAMAMEHYVIVVPVIGSWMLMQRTVTWPTRSRWVGSLLIGVVLVQAPVAVRNYLVAGDWVVSSTSVGMNFWIGNGQGATGHYRELRFGRGDIRFEQEDARQIASAASNQKLSSNEASQWWLNRTLLEVAAEPSAWINVLTRKAGLVVGDYEWPDGDAYGAYLAESQVLGGIGTVFRFGVLFPLFVIGVILAFRAKPQLRPIMFSAIALLCSVMLFYVFGRYRYAAIPLMYIVIGGCATLGSTVRGKHLRLAVVVGLAGAISFIPIDMPARNQAVNYYAVGVEAVNLKRLTDAKRMFLHSAQLAPFQIYPHFGLATVYRRTQEWALAEQSLRRVIAISPGVIDAHRLLGEALVGLGDDLRKRGDVAGALAAYSEVLSMTHADNDDRNNARSRLDLLAL